MKSPGLSWSLAVMCPTIQARQADLVRRELFHARFPPGAYTRDTFSLLPTYSLSKFRTHEGSLDR